MFTAQSVEKKYILFALSQGGHTRSLVVLGWKKSTDTVPNKNNKLYVLARTENKIYPGVLIVLAVEAGANLAASGKKVMCGKRRAWRE